MADYGAKPVQYSGLNRVNYTDPTQNSRRLEVPGVASGSPKPRKPITPYQLRRLQLQNPIQAEHGGQGPQDWETTADYERGAAGEANRATPEYFSQPAVQTTLARIWRAAADENAPTRQASLAGLIPFARGKKVK